MYTQEDSDAMKAVFLRFTMNFSEYGGSKIDGQTDGTTSCQ